jgi:hypothetical protein
MKRGWVALVAGACLLMAGSTGVAQGATKKVTAGSALSALERQTRALPKTAVSQSQRRRLHDAARRARTAARSKPCVSVAALTGLRAVLHTVSPRKTRAGLRVAALGPASLTAARLLLADRRTKRCGGGTPSTLAAARISVLSSDINGMRVRVELPAVQFTPRSGGGRYWTQLVLPDTTMGLGHTGTPGIPVVAGTFAVPNGATVAVKTMKTSSTTLGGVDLFPTQPDPVGADAPFTINRKAYISRKPVPAKAAAASVLGTVRDLRLGGLRLPVGQYDPATRKLKLFTSVDVDVKFNGATKAFNNELASPWERPARARLSELLNAKLVTGLVKDRGILHRCGEEMLVITNAATQAATDQFATAKRAQGLRTTVVQIGDAAGQIGTTATAIQAFIRGRLTAAGCVHPSAITILGDNDLVPTFTGVGGIPSDLPYALRDGADELPDVTIGRIPGNDQAAVSTAVTKIIGYETSPPAGAMFTAKTLVNPHGGGVGFFGTTRDSPTVHDAIMALGFLDALLPNEGRASAERTGDALVTGKLRLAGISPPVTDSTTRAELYLWHDFGDPSMQMWGGGRTPVRLDTTQIKAVYQRAVAPTPDPPPYQVRVTLPKELIGQPVSLLRGGEVVGKAIAGDGEATIPASFGDGAVAPGDLRVAIEPDGGPAVQVAVSDIPTLVSALTQSCSAGGQIGVPVTVSGTLTGAPTGAQVDVTFTTPTTRGGAATRVVVVSATIDAQGAWSVSVTPAPGETGGWTAASAYAGDSAHEASTTGPCTVPVVRRATTLTQSCPASGLVGQPLSVSGHLDGAPAGSVVTVTFLGPPTHGPDGDVAGRSVAVPATTDAAGNWSAALTPNSDESGDWIITPDFAGDGSSAPSTAEPCTVPVS